MDVIPCCIQLSDLRKYIDTLNINNKVSRYRITKCCKIHESRKRKLWKYQSVSDCDVRVYDPAIIKQKEMNLKILCLFALFSYCYSTSCSNVQGWRSKCYGPCSNQKCSHICHVKNLWAQ